MQDNEPIHNSVLFTIAMTPMPNLRDSRLIRLLRCLRYPSSFLTHELAIITQSRRAGCTRDERPRNKGARA